MKHNDKIEKRIENIVSLIVGLSKEKIVFADPLLPFGTSWETLVQWATDNADVQSDASYFGEGVLSATFANTVSVTDNAACGLLTIQSDNEINGNIILSNSIGQKIDKITPKGNSAVIETSKLQAGIYFVSVNDKTVKLMVK